MQQVGLRVPPGPRHPGASVLPACFCRLDVLDDSNNIPFKFESGMLSQRAAGTLLLVTSCSLYAYYTFWVLITVRHIFWR